MATDSEFYPKDDHSWKTWMFQEYLQVRGPLTEENVMEYFEESFLFDRSSNNNVMRMQTQHADPNSRMSRIETESELKRFTGMEYALVHAQPPLFVIQQRDRLSPTEVRPTAVYFILNNVLYSGPDLYTLLSTKLTNALNMIQGSLDILRAARPDYTPRIGHVWPIIDEPTNKPGTSKTAQQTARQGSLVPGTPMDISGSGAGTKGHDPAQAGTKRDGLAAHGNETTTGTIDEENETNQIWEPFAFALQSMRFEMEKRQHAAMLASAQQQQQQQQQQLLGTSSGSGLTFAAGGSGAGGGIGAGASTGGTAMSLADDPRASGGAGGAGTRSMIGPDGRTLTLVTGSSASGGGLIPGGSGAAKFTVPTADGPSSSARLKGAPGPPGKPGQGKKKQRRVEKQALKQSGSKSSLPTPI